MAIPDTPITRAEMFLAKAAGQEVTLPEPITREEQYLKAIAENGGGGGGGSNAVLTTPQDLTTAQKIQALLNIDGIRVVMLESGTITLAELAEQIAEINEDGEHVFFDVAALSYPLYLCTMAINYDDGSPVSYRLNDLVTGSISMGSYDGTKTLSTILSEAVNGFYSITVTAVTQDSVTVTGQTVTVRSTDASGAVYATAAYNGQPVSFSVPNGFVYYISITSTLAGHFNPTTASGIINGADVAVTLTYSDFHTIQRFSDVKAALDADVDLTDLVGQQVYMLKDNQRVYFDVADYDETNKAVTLIAHEVLGVDLPLNQPQALAYFDNGLSAGDYSFVDGANTYYFTLTAAIPAGGQLKANNSSFQTFESQIATNYIENGTVSTTAIGGATSLGTAGSGTLNKLERVNGGSNNFGESWLFKWLNSAAAANVQLPQTTKFDRAYVSSTKGWLNGIDADDLNCVSNTIWKCSANTVYECPSALGGIAVNGQPYTVTGKFALASEKEVTGGYSGVDAGDSVLDLYVDAGATDGIKYRGTAAQSWWLRSPGSGYAQLGRFIGSNASVIFNTASNISGVAPCCKIAKTT